MSLIVLLKLVAVFAVIALGWAAAQLRIVGPEAAGVLSQVTFNLFTPALLFRTTAGIAVANLPWTTLAAYFFPTMLMLLSAYGFSRFRRRGQPARQPAAPAVRGLSLSFSNSVQLGIPVVTALFGAAGLAIHISIVSLQSLVLLSTGTVLAETALARVARQTAAAAANRRHTWNTVGQIVRRSLIHPVVLPIILGLAYNATGAAIPGPIDDVLAILSTAVVPLSLVTIGLSLHLYGVAGNVRPAIALSVGKLIVHPALVLALGYWVFGLRGLVLIVAVMYAALPIGSNVLLFANRYETLPGETTAAIVASTTTFLVTGSLWLLVLTAITG